MSQQIGHLSSLSNCFLPFIRTHRKWEGNQLRFGNTADECFFIHSETQLLGKMNQLPGNQAISGSVVCGGQDIKYRWAKLSGLLRKINTEKSVNIMAVLLFLLPNV